MTHLKSVTFGIRQKFGCNFPTSVMMYWYSIEHTRNMIKYKRFEKEFEQKTERNPFFSSYNMHAPFIVRFLLVTTCWNNRSHANPYDVNSIVRCANVSIYFTKSKAYHSKILLENIKKNQKEEQSVTKLILARSVGCGMITMFEKLFCSKFYGQHIENLW